MKLILYIYLCYVWWSLPAYGIKNRHVGLGQPNTPENINEMEFEDNWFVQKLDHFNPTDNRTWKQVQTIVIQKKKNYYLLF